MKWIRPPASAGSDSPDKEVPVGTEQGPAIGARLKDPSGEALPHPYRVLELPVDATAEQIRARFQQLIRANHPDKLQHADPAQVEQASRKLQHLIEAFDDLKKKGEV
jgi:DnaJ-class molecular chaperone